MSAKPNAGKSLGKRKDRNAHEQQSSSRKKPRKDGAQPAATTASVAEPTIERNPPKVSLLQQEEKSFPRGGATVLTPLERKQIQVQATKDVLFEEKGQKAPPQDYMDSEDENAAESTDVIKPIASKRSKKSKKPKTSTSEQAEALEPRIRSDGLKPKRLTPGTLVLGTVSRINPNSISLDLPNNLKGTVSITSMSSVFTEKLQAMARAEEFENEGDSPEREEDIDLKNHFTIGQYLRACVVSAAEEDVVKGKKGIQLSIEPQLTNRGMSKSDIGINTMIQASVVSVEDHGLIMDMGLNDDSVKGFMSSKEIPEELDYGTLKAGTVFLSFVTGMTSNGKAIKLSANLKKAQKLLKTDTIGAPQTVKSLLPGLAVELLVSQVSDSSIAGKLMGSVDAAADVVHCGAGSRKATMDSIYKPGMKVKGRIIFANPGHPGDTIGISVLEHILSLSSAAFHQGKTKTEPVAALPIGSIVEQAKVVHTEPGLGVYIDVGIKGILAFAHLSRMSDERLDSISHTSGAYRAGSSHRARILGYNSVDGMFSASLEKSVLEQEYLRVEDVPVGETLQVTIEKIVLNHNGVAGLLVNIAKGINGFIPEIHMSDVHLQHPERKFKEGAAISARVLSVNEDSRKIRMTLKKALLALEGPIWKSYEDMAQSSGSVGTISHLKREGAIVKFFGRAKAFLPVSQMSDAFIDDPAQHFRVGQTVRVHALSVDPAEQRATVTCRIPSENDAEEAAEFARFKAGQLVSGKIIEKSSDDLVLQIKNSALKASLSITHLSDGSDQKNASEFKRLREGQSMSDLLILEMFPKKKSIVLSQKPSLVGDAKNGKFLTEFEQVNPDMSVNGFVRNITAEGVFVGFGSGLTALLHRTRVTDDMAKQIEFGLRKDQSISGKILFVDYSQKRFNLTMKDSSTFQDPKQLEKPEATPPRQVASQPLDGVSNSLGDYAIGNTTKAKITSVKDTQLNVRLAENIQGRIDASEAFNSWAEIADRKRPLKAFRVNQEIPVRILGIHDARNHKFLPISHRGGKVPVFEVSAKLEGDKSILSLEQLAVGSWHTVFVNNVSDQGLWVNVSPNVRGRIERMDISQDVSVLNDLEDKFPIGSAMRVRVKNVDISNGRLDLSTRDDTGDSPTSFDSLTVGMILTGRVTKVTDRLVMIQLGPNIAGSIGLTELADDFSQANPGAYNKNDIARVCVLDIDKPNKKVVLSARPSKVLSSSLKVTDPYIASIDKLNVNDKVRGFVKSVADAGVFVSLSPSVTAFVRISDLSDSYLKDWKAEFEVDLLVTGKIVALDPQAGRAQMSLKASVVSDDYIPRTTFNDLKVGQIVTGKIRKVEEFGAFIVVDNSYNVSGLCHRSEMAETRVEDARKIYEEGDNVKAIVLNIEPEKRKVSLGLKASYFDGGATDDSDASESGGDSFGFDEENESDMEDQEREDGGGIELPVVNGVDRALHEDSDEDVSEASSDHDGVLEAGGFDWDGAAQQDDNASEDPSDADQEQKPAKKLRREPAIQVDQTGDLDALGPRSANDFERLLLGQRDSSSLWVQYMAFYLQLSEVDQARNVAERALKEINIREQEEKMNVWVAYINLENAYGTEESVEEVFTRACEVSSAQEMHERLISIYIQSGKHKKAHDLFETMTKKETFKPDPKFWLNYADFAMGTLGKTDLARGLLDRATKSVQPHLHRNLVSKFAQLEFRSKNGDPERGRTMFERLLDTYPKQWDLWDVLIQMEMLQGDLSNVRDLYERMTSVNMKSSRAKKAFKEWLKFEEKHGDQGKIDHVKAKAAESAGR